MSFGENLRNLREKHGIERKSLAQIFEMPYTTLKNYENGEREPGHSFIIKVAKYFGVTTDFLLDNDVTNLPFKDNIPVKKSEEVSDHEYQMILAYRSQPAMQAAVDRILGLKSEDVSTEALKEQIKRSGFTVPKDFDKIVERANTMSELLNQKSPAKK